MSMPFFGEEFSFTQPDGTELRVRGWGDQHNAVFETLDGFTVVEDPVTRFYEYATLSDDGQELQPSGLRPGPTRSPRALDLAPRLRNSRQVSKAQAQTSLGLPRGRSRWETRRARARMALRFPSAPGLGAAPPQRETVGSYVGLCLLVQFPDVPGTITEAEVEAFWNQPGYTGFGNRGSVYDYFADNSGGKLEYTNIVTPYYTTRYPRAYYTNPAVQQPIRTWELIKEALDALRSQSLDFSGLTSDDEDYVYALNVFYAGKRVNQWAQGLWPHSFHLRTPYQLARGKLVYDYQITDMDHELTLSTFCHENGHMVCDFPDLYDYEHDSNGVGKFCLMCAGGVADKKNPTQVCAYLKYRAGWAQNVQRIAPGLNATVTSGQNEFFIHRRNRTEYFIIENRQQSGRDQALPDSGLAIWHVDELGSNDDEEMTATSHYECALVQADGQFDLEAGRDLGDSRDLFEATVNDRFSDATVPGSQWWDGTSSGLDIRNISTSAPVMTFAADV